MLLSVANSRPRNIESIQTRSLYPSALAESAQELIGFIERYYEYLNSTGLPSNEIASIAREKDIDIVSDKYLTQIQSLIARNIPNSRVLDKVTLYRIIMQYYHTRGSEDSIHTFFKIFFNEIVDIFYPKEYLFDLSGGSGEWISIDIPSLRTIPLNPNKSTLVVNSDAVIGNFRSTNLGPYSVVLRAKSKNLWTFKGKAKSSNIPYVEKVNISANGEQPVFRWVYRYKDVFELYSTNDTQWPDEADWNLWSRNIEFVSLPEDKLLLESNDYLQLENSNIITLDEIYDPPDSNTILSLQDNSNLLLQNTGIFKLQNFEFDYDEDPNQIFTKNLIYDRVTIIPKNNITIIYNELWNFDVVATTLEDFSVTTDTPSSIVIKWGDLSTGEMQSTNKISHVYSSNLSEVDTNNIITVIDSGEVVELLDESGKFLTDEKLNTNQLISEQIIPAEYNGIDIGLYGISTQDRVELLMTESGILGLDDVIVTEAAGTTSYISNPANIEYTHNFSIEALPEISTRLNEFLQSLEDAPIQRVYRSSSISPVIWSEIDPSTKVWRYTDNKSFSSDLYKLHDGEYWQKYSYSIRSRLQYDDWGYDYLRFVHPAGLKLFSAILYQYSSRNNWSNYIGYSENYTKENYSWLKDYIPPAIGYHTPRSQPGWLSGNERTLTFIMSVLRDMSVPDLLTRRILITLTAYLTNSNTRNSINHTDYQGWLKYYDSNELICGFSNITLEQASASYNRKYSPFSNISSFISFIYDDKSYYPWYYSQLIPLDPMYEDTDLNYYEATVDEFSNIDIVEYNNSDVTEKEPLSYRYPLTDHEGQYFIDENDTNPNNSFVTEGQAHVWSAELFSNVATIDESETIRFYAYTKNIPDDTILYWELSRVDDISPNSGYCIVQNGVCSFKVIPDLDNQTEGPHTFYAKLKQSIDGLIIATSQPVTINDYTIDISGYDLTSSTSSTIEGGGITFTLTTPSLPDNSAFYYEISGSAYPNRGTFLIESNTGTFNVIGIPNQTTPEPNKLFTVSIYDANSKQLVATSSSHTIIDAISFWSPSNKWSILDNFSIKTSDSSPLEVGWSDGLPKLTLQSSQIISYNCSL